MPARSHLQLINIHPREADDRAGLAEGDDDDGAASGARVARMRRSPDSPSPLSLEEAFKQYAPHVAAIGFRILGSRDQMQDLVQDVFLKAHDWIARIDDPRALKSWLTTVTVREARARLRLRRMRAFLHLSDHNNYASVASPTASPAERALATEIYRILDGVPVNARVAWTLRQVEGLTLPEIAQHCGCSLATVKRRVAEVHRIVLEALRDDQG
ncbi:MAG TPA: sigma-70 family RNA polymerase sigma factor [Polyangiaceae bacterium]|jgi:RNA polymerase sigma-70 factor (ECF subfamily)|nr:sigma-70 family RNA polymerase sigma factor [Polyangiaceae bacterium]